MGNFLGEGPSVLSKEKSGKRYRGDCLGWKMSGKNVWERNMWMPCL